MDNHHQEASQPVVATLVADLRRLIRSARLSDWLYDGFKDQNLLPIMPEYFVTVLHTAFQRGGLTTNEQREFRSAAVEALCMWQASDDLLLVEELGRLSTRLNAVGAIPVMASLIDDEVIVARSWEDRQLDTLTKLISLIADFNRHPRSFEWLNRLFWDDRFCPMLTPYIAASLFFVEPDKYQQYLPRVFDQLEYFIEIGQRDVFDDVFDELIFRVGWDTILRGIPLMPDSAIRKFIELLSLDRIIDQVCRYSANELSHDSIALLVAHPLTWEAICRALPELSDSVRQMLVSVITNSSNPFVEIHHGDRKVLQKATFVPAEEPVDWKTTEICFALTPLFGTNGVTYAFSWGERGRGVSEALQQRALTTKRTRWVNEDLLKALKGAMQ